MYVLSNLFEVHLLKMDRFVTSTRVGRSTASSSKQKATDNTWLEHCKVIENLEKDGMCMKRVHCRGEDAKNRDENWGEHRGEDAEDARRVDACIELSNYNAHLPTV